MRTMQRRINSRRVKKVGGAMIVVALMSAAGVAGAAWGGFRARGGGWSDASLNCGGGMTRLAHVLSADSSVFPGDPSPHIEVVFTVDPDGFLLEEIETGTHTGTHLDAPGHFINGGRTVDELDAEEFVWPAYVIDVRDRMAAEGPDFQLSVDDVRAVERRQGRVPRNAMVIIQTGFGEFFGTEAYLANAPGFAGETVQWLFDRRRIGGVGSDTFGPDATIDELFDATYTALLNDGVALPGLNNVDSLAPNGDLIIAPAVPLIDGSGFQVEPLACHKRQR